MPNQRTSKPIIMVSSSVYQIESLLNQIYGVLDGWGYTVWMSHKGTVPVHPGKTAFENCLEATRQCDLFLGLITPFYGSGRQTGEPSITHREMLLSIEIDKPRWFLAHHDVVFARQILKQYRFKDKMANESFTFRATKVMDHIGVVEIYEAAIRADLDEYEQRTGNWVQEYITPQDVLGFIEAQFGDKKRIKAFLKEAKQS